MITEETPLGDVPELWLKHIEPRVKRGSFRPCWMWQGATAGTPVRYPVVTIEGKAVQARRFVVGLFRDLPRKFIVRDTCGHSLCVNPAHLKVIG